MLELSNSTSLVDWLSLYIGCLVCMVGLVVTRQAYKLSPGFQARLTATGFHQLTMDSPTSDKARVMLSILQNAWPATVSEMLMDTGVPPHSESSSSG